MAIFMQTRQPISRVDMVRYTHDALYSVKKNYPELEILSNPKDSDLLNENPKWDFPVVAGFRWKSGEGGPISYARDIPAYWQKILKENKPEHVVRDIKKIRQEAGEIGMRMNCGLTFVTHRFPMRTMCDLPYGSEESHFLAKVAKNLLDCVVPIERAAVISRHNDLVCLDEVE